MCENPSNNGLDQEVLSQQDLRIRQLNDEFRRTFVGGQIVITQGVMDLPLAFRLGALAAIRSFDAFEPSNDPYGLHDFGVVEVGGQTIWFKIDAYDRSLEFGSPDAADPAVTTRVMTVLLPSEY